MAVEVSQSRSEGYCGGFREIVHLILLYDAKQVRVELYLTTNKKKTEFSQKNVELGLFSVRKAYIIRNKLDK